MNNFWDERFAAADYAYGTEPNEYFRNEILKLKPGKILLPCEGEGRNAVFAAKLGWDVYALDSSIEGRKKAYKLAELNQVEIHYFIQDIFDYVPDDTYDVIGLIFCHFPPEHRRQIHNELVMALNPNGTILLESFNKKQIKLNSGGPKNIDMLYDLNILKEDFEQINIQYIEELKSELKEGAYHSGIAELIRMFAVNNRIK